MGETSADKENKEKLRKALLDEDIYEELLGEINDLRDGLLGRIDSPESTEKLYQAIGGHLNCGQKRTPGNRKK